MTLQKTLSIVLNDLTFMGYVAPHKAKVLERVQAFGCFMADEDGRPFFIDIRDNGESMYRNYNVSQYRSQLFKEKGLCALDFGRLFVAQGCEGLTTTIGEQIVASLADKIRASLRRHKEQICHHDVSRAAIEIVYRWAQPVIEQDAQIDMDQLHDYVVAHGHGEPILRGLFFAKEMRRKNPEVSISDISWELVMRNLTTSTCDKQSLIDYRAHSNLVEQEEAH
ncbi:hypothetical protein [Vibrio owensii]|uniref:hypothetical protein n=1 Tax=Vibrio harveyi group TaxID=717610 RepID=UPI003CC50193